MNAIKNTNLARAGWDDAWQNTLLQHTLEQDPSLPSTLQAPPVARVMAAHGGHVDLWDGLHHRMLDAHGLTLTAGDWVILQAELTSQDARVLDVLPRRTVLQRQAAGEATRAQLVAANLDELWIMTSANADFSLERLERYAAAAWAGGITPRVVLSKVDLHPDPEELLERIRQRLGVAAHGIHAPGGVGMEALHAALVPGRTYGVVGSSGVGKSTLVNVLMGTQALATKDIRAADDKGRHTTTVRQVLLLPNGALLVDTPGMRAFSPWLEGAGVPGFDDVEAVAQDCHYANCTHVHEPGCAVQQAVAEGRLDAARVANLQRLQDEAAWQARRTSTGRAAREARKADAIIGRAIKQWYKQKGRG